MTVLFILLGTLAVALGGVIFDQAKSAVHEIEAFMLFLIGAVLFAAAATLDSLKSLRKELAKLAPPSSPKE